MLVRFLSKKRGKTSTGERLKLVGIFKSKQSDDLISLSYKYLYLCSFFNLDLFSVTDTQINQNGANIIVTIKANDQLEVSFNLDDHFRLLNELFEKFKNIPQATWLGWIAIDPNGYNEAHHQGTALRKKYLQQLIEEPNEITDLDSNSLVPVSNHHSNDATDPVITDLRLIREFLYACGFYHLELSETTIDELKKAHRNMQLKLHPDKIKRNFSYPDFGHTNAAFSDETLLTYQEKRNLLFDYLKKFFDVGNYNRKTVKIDLLSTLERNGCIAHGNKLRFAFDVEFKSIELKHEVRTLTDETSFISRVILPELVKAEQERELKFKEDSKLRDLARQARKEKLRQREENLLQRAEKLKQRDQALTRSHPDNVHLLQILQTEEAIATDIADPTGASLTPRS
jgi:hypothetical protein